MKWLGLLLVTPLVLFLIINLAIYIIEAPVAALVALAIFGLAVVGVFLMAEDW